MKIKKDSMKSLESMGFERCKSTDPVDVYASRLNPKSEKYIWGTRTLVTKSRDVMYLERWEIQDLVDANMIEGNYNVSKK